MDDTQGVECFWSNPKDHPQCPHGPTLLFGRQVDDKLEEFYACAACRDRKLCKFYLKREDKLMKHQKTKWDEERKKFVSRYHHQKLYIRFNELMGESPQKRCYCHDCEKLMHVSECNKHNNHKITEGLTDHQMNNPTEVLHPLDNAKREAQFFFSKKSTEDIVNMLIKQGAKQVLCIGTPKIHEYITQNCEDKMSSLLLDFDGRFHSFFGPLSYCWYNLMNHHFFNENAPDVFKDFLTQNEGKDTFLICDPPFGARVEAMSWTIKHISDLHAKWNGIKNENDCLKIMFVFPYYMGRIMKQKSNPPSISGGLKDLEMSHYKVDYDNHPLFVIKTEGNKLPSPIRIFTNIPLNSLELPESDGYKYCKRCQMWVSAENKHCKKCKACTSISGKRYKHCKLCERCVKPSWIHCKVCERCVLERHTCGQKPKISGRCFKCNEFGHTEKECETSQDDQSSTVEKKKAKKRKLTNETNVAKRRKMDDPDKPQKKKKEKVAVAKNVTQSLPDNINKKKKKQQKAVTLELKTKSIKELKQPSKSQKKVKLRTTENGTKPEEKKLMKQKKKHTVKEQK